MSGAAPLVRPPAAGGSEAWRLVATLTVAGLLSGLAIVGVYQATLPTIQAHQAEALRRAVLKVLPGAERMAPLYWQDGWEDGWQDGGQDGQKTGGEDGAPAPPGEAASIYASIYAGYAGDTLVGYAIVGEGAGFQDTIRLLFGFDPRRQRVVGLEILESRETPGLGDRIYKDPAFLAAFRDLAVAPTIELVQRGASAPNQVDAISGATISSRSVVNIVNTASGEWLPRLDQLPRADSKGGER
jgi:electron transport complex protein RnfG